MQQFLVLKLPRTGSTMLGHVLHAHPQVVCYTEYLNRVRDKTTAEKVAFIRAFYDDPPTRPSDENGALGQTMNPFKYDLDALDVASAWAPGWLPLAVRRATVPWRQLPIRVLLLERRNKLKQAISHASVHQRGSYASDLDDVEDEEELVGQTFDVAALEHQVVAAENRARRLKTVANRLRAPRMTITLEDVQADPQREFDAMFEFLGVPPVPEGFDYTAGHTKVLSDDLRDVVANYDELERSPILAPYLGPMAVPTVD
jgi:LPS sulfotransferase NodH